MGLKEGAKFAGKTLAKKLPLLGLLMSGYFAYDRLKEGDVIGAGLEITSGLLSTVPVIGTAASFGVDALTLAYDMYGRDKLKGVNQGLMNVGHGIAGGLNWGYDKLKQTTGINNIFAATPIGSAAMVVDPLLKTIGMPTIAGTTNWLYDKGSQMISHPIGTLAAVGGIAGMLFTKRGRATISKTATGVISKGLEKLPKSIDEVKKIISDISKKLKIDGLLEAIRSIKTSVSETLKRFNLDGITSSLKSLTSIWNGLKGKITNGINSIISKFGIVQTISNTINTVKGYASKLASGIINLPKTISSTFSKITNTAINKLGSIWTKGINTVNRYLTKISQTMHNLFNQYVAPIINKISEIISAIQNLGSSITHAFSNAISRSPSLPNIPRM